MNKITIDGKTIELTDDLVKEFKSLIDKVKDTSLPSWEEIFRNNSCSMNDYGEFQYNTITTSSNRYLRQRSATKLCAINKFFAVADYLNDGWIPDWKDKHEDKWKIAYSFDSNYLMESSNTFRNDGAVYFKTKELALKAIDIFKANNDEKLLLSLFDVE